MLAPSPHAVVSSSKLDKGAKPDRAHGRISYSEHVIDDMHCLLQRRRQRSDTDFSFGPAVGAFV